MAKRYSAKFKLQVVTELLAGDKRSAQVAKAYGIHPNTVNTRKQTFLEKGPEVFAQDSLVAEYERRIAELERLIGKEEVESALSKKLLGTQEMTSEQKVQYRKVSGTFERIPHCVALAQKSPWRNGEALARAPEWDPMACLSALLAYKVGAAWRD